MRKFRSVPGCSSGLLSNALLSLDVVKGLATGLWSGAKSCAHITRKPRHISHSEKVRSKPAIRLPENSGVLGPSPRKRRAQEALPQERNINHILTTDSLRSGVPAEAPGGFTATVQRCVAVPPPHLCLACPLAGGSTRRVTTGLSVKVECIDPSAAHMKSTVFSQRDISCGC